MKHKFLLKCILYICMILAMLYMAVAYAEHILIEPNLFIHFEENGDISIFTYKDYGTQHKCIEDPATGTYTCSISDFGDTVYDVEFRLMDGREVVNVFINGVSVENDLILDIGKWSNYIDRNVIYAILLKTQYHREFAFVAILILVFELLVFLGIRKYWCIIKEAFSIFHDIGCKAILISVFVTVASCVMYYGVDVEPLVGSINLQQKGVDIYQLEAAFDGFLGHEFPMWAYNVSMLIFWDVVMTINRLFCGFEINDYLLLQSLLIKLVNILLLNGTVLIVLTELKRLEILKDDKETYYWSIFNPCVFWVAIIYIQFDMFPIFIITLGTVLLQRKKCMWLGIVMIAIGVTTKPQMYLCLPIAFVGYMILVWAKVLNHEKVLYMIIKSATSLFIVIYGGIAVYYIYGGPVYEVLSNNSQAERIWYGIFSVGMPIYISFFSLVLLLIIWIHHLHYESVKRITLSAILMYGAIEMVFSFSIISTPGSYMMLAGAFTIVYACAFDRMQRIFIASSSILICCGEMFSHVGDITRCLLFLGKSPFFSKLEESFLGEKYVIILSSIAHAAMVAFGVLFLEKEKKLNNPEFPKVF